MHTLDAFDPIVDWATEHPESIPVFERYGLDYCCGGKSLAYVCGQRGYDPDQILKEIQQAIAVGKQNPSS